MKSNIFRISSLFHFLSSKSDNIFIFFNRSLHCQYNKIVGVSDNISKLTTLTYLNLSYNPLESPLPTLKSLIYLTELHLCKVGMQKLPVDFCRNMLHLKTLNLSKNQLAELPVEINRLRRLEELRCSENEISKMQLSICSLNKLKVRI